ncbi:MAG: hypothetical protein WCI73_00170, partial [Phycisphaerae bacterium]
EQPKPDPLNIQARALTFVSFAARSKAAGGVEFKDAEAFFDAAAEGFKFKHDPQHWLPPTLLTSALKERAEGVTSWSIKWTHGLPEFTANLDESMGGGTIRAAMQNVGAFRRTVAVQTPAATTQPTTKPAAPQSTTP